MDGALGRVGPIQADGNDIAERQRLLRANRRLHGRIGDHNGAGAGILLLGVNHNTGERGPDGTSEYARLDEIEDGPVAVSYTHLTLPTICSV